MESTNLREADLLRPVDPAQHSDDWPILELSSCGVYTQDEVSGGGDSPVAPDLGKGLISLLEADVRNPLVVCGKLNKVPRELSHLWLQPRAGPVPMQLETVCQYAYGQYDDGRVELWAAGKAAWYVIRPSRAYRSIYERMVEAVEVLYFCADIYGGQSTKSRKGKGKENATADDVLTRYAASKGAAYDVAEIVFTRHARFLLSSMMLGKESIEWTKTDLWTWMTDTFTDIHQDLVQARKQPAEPAPKAGIKRKRAATQPAGRSVRSASSQNISRRAHAQPTTPRIATPSDDSDVDGATSGKRPRARKGKSTLRPRTSKYVSIAGGDPTDGDTQALESSPQQSPSAIDQDSPLAPSVRPVPSRRSRRGHLIEPEDGMASAEPVDEGIDMSLDHSQDSESDVSSDIIVPPLGGVGKSMAVRLRNDHLVATVENDVWACPLDGCMHRIFAASEPDSQRLIKEHYRRHVDDEDSEMRLELVRKMTAPGLRVDRLMSRIQTFGGQKGFPAPVVRRY